MFPGVEKIYFSFLFRASALGVTGNIVDHLLYVGGKYNYCTIIDRFTSHHCDTV